jgi:parvulin-like peptidyl-prolyl isomerase
VLGEAAQGGASPSTRAVDAQIEQFASQAGGRGPLEEQAAQNGIAAEDLRPFVRSIVLDQALGDKLTADIDIPTADLQALYKENLAQYDRVRTRHILVADQKQARTILANVTKDRSTFPALAAQFSTDTSNKDRGGDLGLAGRGQFVPAFENAIFGAKEGAIVLVQTQFGFHVVEVLERQTTTLAEATPSCDGPALQAERTSLVQELLQKTSAELGVKVNPRFGRWNPRPVRSSRRRAPTAC